MVTFSQAIKSFYGNYANFKGRASLSQYWWVALYSFVAVCILYIPAMLCSNGGQGGFGFWFFMILMYLFALINLIPTIALTVRRLHDTNRGGGWYFISLIPLIGGIWMLVLMLQPSNRGENRFGAQPEWQLQTH